MPTFSEFKNEDDFKTQCGYEIDGVWYPRVTRIVDMKAKPALYRFYGDVGFENGQKISQRSAEEGTAVHAAVEARLTGRSLADMPAAIAPSIAAFEKFLATTDFEVNPEHIEKRIVSRDHRFAGTIDILARIGGVFGLVDVKTSDAVYRDYGLQTSAYVQALLPEFPELQKRWILRIDQWQTCGRCGCTLRTKGGRNKIRRAYTERPSVGIRMYQGGVINHYGYTKQCREADHEWLPSVGHVELKELSNWQHDFKAFLGAKALWEWEHADWLKKIGY
jgi:hypothetical protein